MRRSPRSRQRKSLPAPLDQSLITYALAAGAAGVSLLALAQPSEAEIVYTPAHVVIARSGSFDMDLNHDGVTDFTIIERAYLPGTFHVSSQRLWVKPPKGNKVTCGGGSLCISSFYNLAAAMRAGSSVSSRLAWVDGNAFMASEILTSRGSMFYGWSWINVTDRYLGLRFQINGETHFGWARLSVEFHGGTQGQRTWRAHLTGYAYETVANKSIKAGQIGGTNDGNAVFLPDTLGALALGDDGIALWRGDEAKGDGGGK